MYFDTRCADTIAGKLECRAPDRRTKELMAAAHLITAQTANDTTGRATHQIYVQASITPNQKYMKLQYNEMGAFLVLKTTSLLGRCGSHDVLYLRQSRYVVCGELYLSSSNWDL